LTGFVGKDVWMTTNHFPRDRLDHVAERERALLLGHASVKHHLQQQIAEFVAEVVHIVLCDRFGHLIGFLDGVGRDCREGLFQIPWAARYRRAQPRHDLDEAGNVARRGHACTDE